MTPGRHTFARLPATQLAIGDVIAVSADQLRRVTSVVEADGEVSVTWDEQAGGTGRRWFAAGETVARVVELWFPGGR